MKYLMSVLALCLFFAPVARASDAGVILEAGPIWSQTDAEQKCPQTAAEWQQANEAYQARWTGQWWTTVQGAMSVCEIQVRPAGGDPSPEAGFDAEAGPLWNQKHAEERCRELTEEWNESNPAYEARWSGQWVTTVEGAMSVCGLIIKPRSDDSGAQTRQAQEASPTPAPAKEKKETIAPGKTEASLPAWAGEYCNSRGCLYIGNFSQEPASFSFTFVFDGKEAGRGAAAVDGRNASYADLTFSLKMSDNVVQVSKTPGTQSDPKESWTGGCLGTYMRK